MEEISPFLPTPQPPWQTPSSFLFFSLFSFLGPSLSLSSPLVSRPLKKHPPVSSPMELPRRVPPPPEPFFPTTIPTLLVRCASAHLFITLPPLHRRFSLFLRPALLHWVGKTMLQKRPVVDSLACPTTFHRKTHPQRLAFPSTRVSFFVIPQKSLPPLCRNSPHRLNSRADRIC